MRDDAGTFYSREDFVSSFSALGISVMLSGVAYLDIQAVLIHSCKLAYIILHRNVCDIRF